jgi:hypothetical protein
VLRFKFSTLFCQLSLNMLGRQQRLILLVEQDQQVLQMHMSKMRVPKVAGPGIKLSCANSAHISPFSADFQLFYSIKR